MSISDLTLSVFDYLIETFYHNLRMSFFVKGDFKTREEWLKRQRKELMKKESIKFHEYNSKTNSSKSTVKYPFPEQKGTLSDILKTDDTELAKPADRFQ